jgi:hypothetical protein
MAIIKQKNRKNGIVYVFNSISRRVPEKKWPVSTRQALGHYDKDGDFIPNARFLALSADEQMATGLVDAPFVRRGPEVHGLVRKRCGFELLFTRAASATGVDHILRLVFPTAYKAFLSLLFFNLAEPHLPMYRFRRFDRNNLHPFGTLVNKDMVTELLRMVDEQSRSVTFTMLREKNSTEGGRLLALDSTSIAALGELLQRASRGYSKEGIRNAEQLELLAVYDLETHIPIYYRSLEGKIADVTTVRNTAADLTRDGMNPKDVIFVMDRGYYSDANIRGLLKQRYHFVCALDIKKNNFATEAIRTHGKSILSIENYLQDRDLYCFRTYHRIKIPRRGRGEHAMNLALDICYNPERATREQKQLSKKLSKMQQALASGQITFDEDTKSVYSRFFTRKQKKVYGKGIVTVYMVNKAEEQKERDLCGYFAYISDGSIDKTEVVNAYAQRMMIENSFRNFKERYNRPLHSDDQGVDGQIYITFLTVVLESWIREQMKKHQLYKTYTMRSLFDEIEGIECSFSSDKPKDRTYSEITSKAGLILYAMGVKLPHECWPKKVLEQMARDDKKQR